MFFTFSQPRHVLNMFLNFWRFSASCSYKKGSYKKKSVLKNTAVRSYYKLFKYFLHSLWPRVRVHFNFARTKILETNVDMKQKGTFLFLTKIF